MNSDAAQALPLMFYQSIRCLWLLRWLPQGGWLILQVNLRSNILYIHLHLFVSSKGIVVLSVMDRAMTEHVVLACMYMIS